MRKISILIIVLGLLIAAYPLLERAYTWYMQVKALTEWESNFLEFDDENEYIEMEDYSLLQSILVDGIDESDIVELAEEETINEQDEEALEEQEEEPTPSPSPTKAPIIKPIGVLRIEKISLKMPIVSGTSKNNLRVGAGQIKGTSPLGEVGNAALAAHRSHTFGRFFNRLDEIEIGDVIWVETTKGAYKYTVYKILVVEPEDTSVLRRNNTDHVLTLITCDPIVTATHRLIVHALMEG